MSPSSLSLTQHRDSNMIISHKAPHLRPPQLNLRRAASYNAADKGPLSSSSARFGFDHLAFYSPPPSPGLPLPHRAPRTRRKPLPTPRPSRVIRSFLWLSGLVLLFYLVGKSIRHSGGPEMLLENWVRGSSEDGGGREKEYEMVGQDDLPDFPTPIIVTDRRGRAKWTVSIPPTHEFPLSQSEYVDMCAMCREVSSKLSSMHSHSPITTAIDQISLMAGGPTIPDTDKYFLDVREAELQGFLPGAGVGAGQAPGRVGVRRGADGEAPVCGASLTFVLESDDAGLGRTLMALWIAYGLAQRERRAFFLDDARWAYGTYADMFAPPPPPACRPPPRHERLPCPRQARHLVVTAANAHVLFGAATATAADADADAVYAAGRPGQRALFALARAGHDALFRLTAPDREYVAARARDYRARTHAAASAAGRIVGVHVRRGDCHPLEFQYADSYIPLTQYLDAASALLNASLAAQQQQQQQQHSADADADAAAAASLAAARARSFLVLASDDPLVYDAPEVRTAGAPAVRAQELIRLAGQAELNGAPAPAAAKPPKNVMHKFTAESFGWEGGFFRAMFYNLGIDGDGGAAAAAAAAAPLDAGPRFSSFSSSAAAAAANANARRPRPRPLSAETLRLRSLVGRAYVLDLAALTALTDADGGGGGGGVVCAVSATGCRLLAVMMGEERAFGRGEWRNVDGGFGWHGLTW